MRNVELPAVEGDELPPAGRWQFDPPQLPDFIRDRYLSVVPISNAEFYELHELRRWKSTLDTGAKDALLAELDALRAKIAAL